MSFIAATVHPARRQGLDHAKGIYRIADERLGAGEWAVGSYSIADIHLFRLYWRFFNSLKPEPGTFPESRRALRAHDGAAGGEEDDRDRSGDLGITCRGELR